MNTEEMEQPDLGLETETEAEGGSTDVEQAEPDAVENAPQGDDAGLADEAPEGEQAETAQVEEEELPSEAALIEALRHTHPELAKKLDKAVAPPEPPKTEAEPAEVFDDRQEQSFSLLRERQQIKSNLERAAARHDAILDQIEEKTALIEEADEGSKIQIVLRREVQQLESQRQQLANYHAQMRASQQTIQEVTEFVATIPQLAPYPHDYYALMREGKITADMKLPQIVTLIRSYRAAQGKAAKPVLRETGRPVTATDTKAVIRKVLAKVGSDKPGSKGGGSAQTRESQKTQLSPAAAAALESAKRK